MVSEYVNSGANGYGPSSVPPPPLPSHPNLVQQHEHQNQNQNQNQNQQQHQQHQQQQPTAINSTRPTAYPYQSQQQPQQPLQPHQKQQRQQSRYPNPASSIQNRYPSPTPTPPPVSHSTPSTSASTMSAHPPLQVQHSTPSISATTMPSHPPSHPQMSPYQPYQQQPNVRPMPAPPLPPQSAVPSSQAHHPRQPPPQRPLPPGTTNGMSNMTIGAPSTYPQQTHQHQRTSASLGPPGMISVPVTSDASALPHPDLSGPALSLRISQADPPPTAPHFDIPPPTISAMPMTPSTQSASIPRPVEPATCPSDIFIPTSPRCVRLTTSSFPTTKSLALKYTLPLGAVVHPLAQTDEPIPVVNFASAGIVRCRQCRSYINFSSVFIDGGRRWKCSLCSCSNECPQDYFSPLDEYGKRRDAAQRPELHRGSVEFVAPAEYMVRPPMPPVYLFLLETTPAAVNSGMLSAAIGGIRRSIDSMPNEGRTRIAIMTFDSAVHFYLLKCGEDASPSVYVVSDIDDVFLPTPDDVLAQLTDCRPCFEKALTLIEETYKPSGGIVSSACCLGAAMKGAQRAMELVGGKMMVFSSSRPTVGPGKLRERGESGGILGTDRERAILRPETEFYRQLAVTMSKCQIGCDLFICAPVSQRFMDVGTLAQASKFTGGELFYCANFDVRSDGPRLQLVINRVLAREAGLEAVMRIRATKSVRCTKFSGRFFVRSTDLLAMPNVDADKAFAVQFNIEDVTLVEGSGGDSMPFCLQVALLYTTTSGERRIRVHTIAIPLVNNLHDLFVGCDVGPTSNIMLRMAAESMKDRNLEDLRKMMTEKLTGGLAKYKLALKTQYPGLTNAGGGGGYGQGQQQVLVMTEAMKLLPLMIHGIGRSAVLSRDVCGAFMYQYDEKSAVVHDIDVMSVAESSAFIYPNIMQVIPWATTTTASNEQQGVGKLGKNENQTRLVKHANGVSATFESLKNDCGLLIDDGRSVTLWLGDAIAQRFLTELLGTPMQPQQQQLPEAKVLGVELMRRGARVGGVVGQVFTAVKTIVAARKPFVSVLIAVQSEKSVQARIEALMVEERTASIINYRDYFIDIQRSVTQLSSR